MSAPLRFVSFVAFTAIGLVTSVAACGDDDTAAPAADGGTDVVAPPDSSPPADTGVVDSGVDAPIDAGPDVFKTPPPLGVRDRSGRPYLAYLLSPANREAYNTASVQKPIFPTDPPDAASTFGADLQSSLTM